MEIKSLKIVDLIPYDKNPRNNDKAIQMVVRSIEEFGFKVPIVVDKNNVIVAGHTRYRAVAKMGWSEVPCVIADDLSDQQIKAFRIADNRVAEFSEWDDDLLKNELIELDGMFTGFSLDDFLNDDQENPYTKKVDTPIYKITDNDPDILSLVNSNKTKYLLEAIEQSGVSKEQKEFLKMASYRHLVFSYKDIADYYARANEEMQELMEMSALVIIDYEKAIDLGYIELSKSITDAMDESIEF